MGLVFLYMMRCYNFPMYTVNLKNCCSEQVPLNPNFALSCSDITIYTRLRAAEEQISWLYLSSPTL